MNKGDKPLIANYYSKFHKLAVNFFNNKKNILDLQRSVILIKKVKKNDNIVYLIGNGGSSAVAEHMAIDLTKNAGVKALSISGTPMLTTFANDYGYENVFKKPIEKFGKKKDILIAISSSGTSKNILNACESAKMKGMKIITLSGFSPDNPLRKLGDINFWVDTKAYGFLEILHGFILHYINDSIIGSEIYMIK